MASTRALAVVTTFAALLLATGTAFAGHEDGGAPAAAADANAPPMPSPDDAVSLLTAGNERFVKGTSTHPHQNSKRITEIAGGQHPFATVLSCSDSRVPPEVLFDEGLGDIFSVRVAGNVANTDEMGSVEYGVDHLGTPLLVVMGHTKCGAVTAVATHATVHGHIPALVAKIGPAVDAARAKAAPGASDLDIVPDAIKRNVFEAMATMLNESESVRERVDNGKTRMEGAIYDITTGTVTWLGPHPDQARLVAEAKAKPAAGHGDAAAAAAHVAAPGHGKSKSGHGGKHGECGPAKVHGVKEEPPPPALPPGPSESPPFVFAIVVLVATLGGSISGRLTSK